MGRVSDESLIRDKVFSLQLFDKDTGKMVGQDFVITRQLQMKQNEKGLKDKFGKELISVAKKLSENPKSFEMLLQ